MFDKSFLEEALFEFVVISDTHYMLDVGDAPLEFESRRKQTGRGNVALAQAAALGPDFVIHLGDRCQEYPGTDKFEQAMAEAEAQLSLFQGTLHQVPGNHDLGDKPDPTMPAAFASPEFLEWYHSRIGPSWFSFGHQGCHFVILNSQIMNSALPEAAEQQEWLEIDLEQNKGRRTFIFLHLPPYLWDENEQDLGHYDNIGEPARSWLLGLIAKYSVELFAAGHVHFAFFDHFGSTRFHVATSTSFTRPGFPHVFVSPPPPEQGRDDAPKLGFYFYRVLEDRTDIHFIRTEGSLELDDNEGEDTAKIVNRVSAGLPNSPLGIHLRDPLTTFAEVPVAWPACIREKVRNDYPLLSILELGASWVRVPFSELLDPFQRGRISILRKEGVRIVPVSLWHSGLGLEEILEEFAEEIDGWEIQVPGDALPPLDCLDALSAAGQGRQLPLHLSTAVPREIVEGKQHPRTRIGYRPEELAELDPHLAAAGVRVTRALCRIAPNASPWFTIRQVAGQAKFSSIRAVDFFLESYTRDDRVSAARAAEALFAIRLLPSARILFDPFIDLDRTMDAFHGFLDTLCNPRPIFHALRTLNSVLFSQCEGETPSDLAVTDGDSSRLFSYSLGAHRFTLNRPTLPEIDEAHPASGSSLKELGHSKCSVFCKLEVGRVSRAAPEHFFAPTDSLALIWD